MTYDRGKEIRRCSHAPGAAIVRCQAYSFIFRSRHKSISALHSCFVCWRVPFVAAPRPAPTSPVRKRSQQLRARPAHWPLARWQQQQQQHGAGACLLLLRKQWGSRLLRAVAASSSSACGVQAQQPRQPPASSSHARSPSGRAHPSVPRVTRRRWGLAAVGCAARVIWAPARRPLPWLPP